MMTLFWILLACLMMLMAAVIFARDYQKYRMAQKVDEKFVRIVSRKKREQIVFSQTLSRLIHKISNAKPNDEIGILLFRAGWTSKVLLRLVRTLIVLAPFAIALMTLGLCLFTDAPAADASIYIFFAFALTYVGLRQLLRYMGYRKHQQIRAELIPFLHLIKMLFISGLSLEHALRIISTQSRTLTPCLAGHLQRATSNISAGQDHVEALNQLARTLEVTEFTEVVAMLCQMARYGGNIKSSLDQYITTIEQRYFQELRERLSKLSAKMSIVMVLFMFPALMIFIAGPGFIGLAKALSTQ